MSSVDQPTLANTFMAGSSGSAILQGAGFSQSLGTSDGAQFDTVFTTGGTLTYDNTVAHSGTQSCKIATSSSNSCCLMWAGSGLIINATTQNWFRLYLYQTVWPSVIHPIFNATVSGEQAAAVLLNTNGTLSMRDANGNGIFTTTNTVPNNAWYRIEGYITSSATTGQVELKLFTSPDSTTPTETKTSSATLDTYGGNLNQIRFGMPYPSTSTTQTWWMDDVALSTSGYIGPGAIVFHMACGAPTDSGFSVNSKAVGATSVRLKVATDPALTQNVFYVSAQEPDQYGYTQHVVTGLDPSTTYYCQLADTPPGGSEMLMGSVGQCTTLPVPGSVSSFTVAFASCIDTGDDQPSPMAAIDDWVDWAPDLSLFLGDYNYMDPTETTVEDQLGNIEYQSMYWGNSTLTQNAWGYYLRSDHDTTTDGGDSDNSWTSANLLAMQEAFPYASLPDPNSPVHGLYQSWVTGRVRFIMLDMRNIDRSPVANTDNSSKTMLGANQLAWLFDQLTQPEPLKVIVTDSAWIGGESANSCGPCWGYYTTERAAILSFLAANPSVAKNIMLWHGDDHGVACCPGWNNPDGGFPVYCAAPVRQTGAAFNANGMATFTQAYNNDGGACRNYGRVTITDSGQTITVNFQGWDALNQVAQVEQTDVFNVSAGSHPALSKGLLPWPG